MKKRFPGIALAIIILLIVFSPVAARASIDASFPPGGDGEVVDTGYSPYQNGFAFANFGDPVSIAGVDLNLLAGTRFHDEIFSHTGHCFGMAMASVERFMNSESSADLDAAGIMPEIDRIQTEQSFYYIADFFRPPFGGKKYNCTAEFARLYGRLSEGRPAVIGVYSTTGDYPGHAVVAYKIETLGEKSYIYAYDPNFPATQRDYAAEPVIAVYDSTNGTFLYDNGRTFDELQLDDVDRTGIVMGKTLSAGFVGAPCVAIALLIWRPRFLRRP